MMNKRKLKQVLNCQGGILTTLRHRANSLQVNEGKLADRADDHEERIAVLERAMDNSAPTPAEEDTDTEYFSAIFKRLAAIESTISGLQHAACETANEITGLAALIAALGERVVELADRLRAVETAREVLDDRLNPVGGNISYEYCNPEPERANLFCDECGARIDGKAVCYHNECVTEMLSRRDDS